MQAIKNNPYRIIGLLAGTSLKDQTRQTNRLKQYIEAEQEVTDDFSFPALGQLNRTLESINDAASKLNLNNDRITAALFWFYNGSHIDEASFDSLKDDDTDNAISIWERRAVGEVSVSNHSAYQNLSTLKLNAAFTNGLIYPSLLEEGMSLKLKFLESDFVKDLKAITTDETFRTTKKDLQLYFLKQVQFEFEKNGGNSTREFLEIISKQTFTAKDDFLAGFIQKPIEQLENLIQTSKAKRKTKKDVIIAGDNLYKEAKPILDSLKTVLGTSNLKFQSITDKVSDEILQCGVQLFNDYREHETYDAGPPAMTLFKQARVFAIGNVARQRCSENTQNLQEWIDDKPNRDIEKKVGKDIEFIIEKLNLTAETLKNKGQYPEGYNDPYSKLPLNDQPHNRGLRKQNSPFDLQSPSMMWTTDPLGRNPNTVNLFRLARDIVKQSKPKLENIKNTLGATNEIYQKLSTDLASLSLACLIEYVNSSANQIQSLGVPPNIDEHEINAMNAIGELDMDFEMRKRFNEQKQALNRLQQAVQRRSSVSSRTGSGGSCYIATMAYGHYDHPQVIILRQFRDNVLAKYIAGRLFIKIYYYFSPKLVQVLQSDKTINSIIRKALNQFIKLIKK